MTQPVIVFSVSEMVPILYSVSEMVPILDFVSEMVPILYFASEMVPFFPGLFVSEKNKNRARARRVLSSIIETIGKRSGIIDGCPSHLQSQIWITRMASRLGGQSSLKSNAKQQQNLHAVVIDLGKSTRCGSSSSCTLPVCPNDVALR